MTIDLVLIADLNASCGDAKITDETVYGVAPYRREDFGIVLMVLENGVPNYTLSDFSNAHDEWYIPIQNNTPYVVMGYMNDKWVAGAWSNNAIVYYEPTGMFYINTSGGHTVQEPEVSAAWTLITNDVTGYNYLDNFSFNIEGIDIQQSCPNYVIEKVECDDPAVCCKEYRVCDNSGNLNLKDIALFDYNETLLSSFTLDPSTGNCVDMIIPDQGVYIVAIKNQDILDIVPNDINKYEEYFVIYEYCQLMHCVLYLIDKILCSTDPCDQICNPCNEDKIAAMKTNREELNRLIALFGSLMAMIHAERIKYLGLFSWGTTRANFVAKIGLMMKKILEISIRCGMCADTQVDTTDNPIFTEVQLIAKSRSRGCQEC